MSVTDARHPHEWASTSPAFYNQQPLEQTYSEDRGVTLGHGIAIGDGAVIASHSAATKDAAPYTAIGGLPARVIRKRFGPETVRALQASAWREKAPEDPTRCDARSPDLFAAQVLRGREQGDFRPLGTRPLTAEVIAEYLRAGSG